MNSPQQLVSTTIPDLRDMSLEQVARLDDSVLAHSLDLYRRRLDDNCGLGCAFSSSI